MKFIENNIIAKIIPVKTPFLELFDSSKMFTAILIISEDANNNIKLITVLLEVLIRISSKYCSSGSDRPLINVTLNAFSLSSHNKVVRLLLYLLGYYAS